MPMDERRTRGLWLLMTALAVVAYHLSLMGALMLLPLAWLGARQGYTRSLSASLVALVTIAVVRFGFKALMHDPWTSLDLVSLSLPVVTVAGWLLIVALKQTQWRFLYRLTIVTVFAGIVLFPLMSWLLVQQSFVSAINVAYDDFWKQMAQTPGFDSPGVLSRLDRSEFFEVLKTGILSFFLVALFLIWALTGRVARVFESTNDSKTLKDFFLPPQASWVLLGLWGLLLVQAVLALKGIKWEWGYFEYVVLNAASIALIVHALAGLGIIGALMERWKWSRLAKGSVWFLIIALCVVPGAGQLVVMVTVPMLAVLELWANFRKRTQGVEK